jgi:hypothetical protein
MKINKLIIAFAAMSFLSLTSCSNWLEQENKEDMSESDTYSDEAGIRSVVANLYSRMVNWQDFGFDSESYDMCRWDEAINNSQYWAFATNADQNYRVTYDYTYIRELNLHIQNLTNLSNGKIPDDSRKYYLAEARWLRAYYYFKMVVQLGGVPLITDVTEYTSDPTSLAKPRNTEAEIYDFIISEMDAIKDDFGSSTVKTRATKAAALALKCRAALYAGTLAVNYNKSATLNLNLSSGATGISSDKASTYLHECLDACKEIEAIGSYSLFKKNSDYAENYANIFVSDYSTNPEIILCKAYDGVNVTNYFTSRAIPRSVSKADLNKTSCQVNPILNLVNSYEKLSTKTKEDIDAYVGDEQVEDMASSSSTLSYNVYDHPEDAFVDRDPRLKGTVLYPGSSFRDQELDLRAGLAIPSGNGYIFKSAASKTALSSNNEYEGQQMTGVDGPLRDGQPNYYISHTGFLLRKYVDPTAGSELNGVSTVPYIFFRYGEVLLNAAEAAYYLGDKATALSYINQIRERAGGTKFKLTEEELTLDRIKNERRVELSFEDHRYEDMKRWRDADEYWKYDVNSPTASLYVLWPYRIYDPGKNDDGKWIFRKMRVGHRANNGTISFDRSMYYSSYPMNEGNPYIEKNPNQ